MNQDIDLLDAVAAERKPFPRAWHAGVALLSILAITVFASNWQAGRVAAAEQSIDRLNSEIDDLVFGMEERSQFLVDRNADPRLLEQIAERERELKDKTMVLDLLQGESLGNTRGFADQLAALGRRHPDGLWLQRIVLDEGGRELELKGRALEARLIADFLDALEAETAFAGVAFERVRVTTSPAGADVGFVLGTGCVSDEQATDDACAADDAASPDAAAKAGSTG